MKKNFFYSWQSYPNPDDSSLADLTGIFTIHDGNGKFENASGEGEISGVADADPFNPRFYPYGEFQGTITY